MSGTRSEFDPTSERHMFGFVVKVVDPGCTIEVQIEEADGTVTRITTTESRLSDGVAITQAIMAATLRFMARMVPT